MPHPRDWQDGQMPRSCPGKGAGRNWNWLMHNPQEFSFLVGRPTLGALTIRPKVPVWISGNFHGRMVQNFPGDCTGVENDKPVPFAVLPSNIENGRLSGTFVRLRNIQWFTWFSGKEDNLMRYTQIFENFFLEISVPFAFHPGISGIFGWMVRFLEFQQFPDFSGTFPRKCPYHFVPVSKISRFLVKW